MPTPPNAGAIEATFQQRCKDNGFNFVQIEAMRRYLNVGARYFQEGLASITPRTPEEAIAQTHIETCQLWMCGLIYVAEMPDLNNDDTWKFGTKENE